MSDKFNKFQFSKSQKQLGLCCILIGIIGIISIICACTIGSGLNISKGKDPKDYYGIYYVVYDNIYGSFEFTQNKCNFTLSNGVTAGDDSNSFDYEYVSAKYAQKVVESPLYKDRAAILVYTNEGKDNAIVLWVTANAPYQFVMNSNHAAVTTQKPDFASLMGDPKDYYSNYVFDDDTYISFNSDGTASFTQDGITETFMYAYVNQDWLTKYTDSSWSSAIALYPEGSTSFYGFFKYTDRNTVEYNGNTFLRENYPISYNLNGGTNDPENPSFYYGDQDITLREPTKIGYTFTGWSGTDISGTSKTVTIPKGSTGAKTYTANWQANTYTLTLNANGGECDTDQITVSYDAAFALPVPHRAGYTFSGWFHDSNKITDGVWTGTEDMELVAEWEPIEYSISYSLDGGTNNADNPSSYNAEDSAITLKYPVKEGYNFLGWSGTGLTDITKDVMIESGSIGDKTYTAHWEKVSYTITYHLNGGTNSQANPLTFTIDDLPLTLQPPTSSELEFWGWYTSEDFNAETKISQITAAENITLYARFYHKNDNGIVYRLNGDEFTVEKYEGTETEVVIPDTYSGAKVTSVSASAFSGCNAVKSIVIPDSVTSIGAGAFTGCSSLEKITLPFVGTTSTAAGIPQQLFGYVFGTVQYDNSTRITQYTVSGPDGSMRYYRYYLPNSLRQVTITSYDIPNYAFYNCSMLEEISFGSGVKAIGESAFAYSGLLQAEIPDTITSLGRMEAFAYCSSLTKVVIGKGITEIPWSTFSNCTALSDITFSENVTKIGRSAFYNCASLKTIVIPSGITDIGDSAFERCGDLSAIYFGGRSLSDWDKINIANHNDELNSATVYCYSEIAPTADGNYWHYDTDGITPIVWTREQ